MKFRIIKKDEVFYVQKLVRVADVSGVLDMSYDEWQFIRTSMFFKRKFSSKEDAEAYISTNKESFENYEIIGGY